MLRGSSGTARAGLVRPRVAVVGGERAARCRGRGVGGPALRLGPGRPGRERELGTSGTGISGWVTNIVPGLAIVARFWCVAGRKPYSGPRRLGGSSRPTTRIAELGDDAPLDLARGLLRADQDDAERAAALGDVEQDLLDRESPSRGAYLFSSSSTTNSSGWACAVFSLRSNSA